MLKEIGMGVDLHWLDRDLIASSIDDLRSISLPPGSRG
jgi:hypothetical protein